MVQCRCMRSEHVSVVVGRDPATVHAWARDPDHLPLWASGLARSEVIRDGDALVVESPMGRVRVEFVPDNDLGVLDHTVTLPDGTRVLNPMRVVAHPDGAEVLFTARQLGLGDEAFADDVATVRSDLERLARLVVEGGAS